MGLTPWSMLAYCDENQILCFLTQDGALFHEAVLDGGSMCLTGARGGEKGRENTARTCFYASSGKTKGKVGNSLASEESNILIQTNKNTRIFLWQNSKMQMHCSKM